MRIVFHLLNNILLNEKINNIDVNLYRFDFIKYNGFENTYLFLRFLIFRDISFVLYFFPWYLYYIPQLHVKKLKVFFVKTFHK